MKKILLGALIVILVFFGYRYFENQRIERENLEENTVLIQEQIRNVGKLVVTEGSFSQVYSYNDSKSFYFDVLSARKKALIVVNAEVTVAYDLSKLQTHVDEKNKTVNIIHIPEEEISINPDIKYYDVTQDYLNQFDASDYNKIKERINKSIQKKVENSNLKSNARNRLVSELQKIYILTNSMGWTLTYNNIPIQDSGEFEEIKM
ncbi:DUF4230 domain-containing protein [Salegentibacter sp. F188]|uniref:DUF4230 domain-containing protein n=1 Tax=Autumnicola patrickiae TaxID=3075591 RepID=A0ABU3E550_9FLAO|nr:DUF4230 domain-containing protein [Salegentibacter sp. F188]MDT0691114.1 DUF4230 domain-containing protein [Salegentibacter sp. F188]